MTPEIKAFLIDLIAAYDRTIKKRTCIRYAKVNRYKCDPLVSWERNIYDRAKALRKAAPAEIAIPE